MTATAEADRRREHDRRRAAGRSPRRSASIGNVVARAGHVATLSAPAAGRVGAGARHDGPDGAEGSDRWSSSIRRRSRPALQSAEAALQAAERAERTRSSDWRRKASCRGRMPSRRRRTSRRRTRRRAPARRMEQLSMLRSPIAGVVTRMPATLGASADPSQPLVEISDPSALDVLMNVTPTDAGAIRTGRQGRRSAPARSANGEPLGIGSVVDISGTVDSTNRGVAVRVQAPTTRRPLRIGETVFGDIALATRPERHRRPARGARARRRRASRCSSSTRTASRTRAT